MKKYKFSLKDECMKELPSIKYPSCDDEVDENIDGTYKERCIEYLQYAESLQSIPVPSKYINNFEDGKVYTQNEFYENIFIKSVEEDTELKNEVANAYDRYKDSSHVSFIDWIFEHYTITRKK